MKKCYDKKCHSTFHFTILNGMTRKARFFIGYKVFFGVPSRGGRAGFRQTDRIDPTTSAPEANKGGQRFRRCGGKGLFFWPFSGFLCRFPAGPVL